MLGPGIVVNQLELQGYAQLYTNLETLQSHMIIELPYEKGITP